MEQFTSWITFIDDRVDDWKNTLPSELMEKLDYSVSSFDFIENYIVENYSLETLGDGKNKEELDAAISYIGETMRSNLPGAKWTLDLVENSVNYNLPVVELPVSSPISPHHLIRRVVIEKSGSFLKELHQLRLGFIKNPETY